MTAERSGSCHRLEDAFRRLAQIEETAGVPHWDMSAVMPPGRPLDATAFGAHPERRYLGKA